MALCTSSGGAERNTKAQMDEDEDGDHYCFVAKVLPTSSVADGLDPTTEQAHERYTSEDIRALDLRGTPLHIEHVDVNNRGEPVRETGRIVRSWPDNGELLIWAEIPPVPRDKRVAGACRRAVIEGLKAGHFKDVSISHKLDVEPLDSGGGRVRKRVREVSLTSAGAFSGSAVIAQWPSKVSHLDGVQKASPLTPYAFDMSPEQLHLLASRLPKQYAASISKSTGNPSSGLHSNTMATITQEDLKKAIDAAAAAADQRAAAAEARAAAFQAELEARKRAEFSTVSKGLANDFLAAKRDIASAVAGYNVEDDPQLKAAVEAMTTAQTKEEEDAIMAGFSVTDGPDGKPSLPFDQVHKVFETLQTAAWVFSRVGHAKRAARAAEAAVSAAAAAVAPPVSVAAAAAAAEPAAPAAAAAAPVEPVKPPMSAAGGQWMTSAMSDRFYSGLTGSKRSGAPRGPPQKRMYIDPSVMGSDE
jgi:hypothetical protein